MTFTISSLNIFFDSNLSPILNLTCLSGTWWLNQGYFLLTSNSPSLLFVRECGIVSSSISSYNSAILASYSCSMHFIYYGTQLMSYSNFSLNFLEASPITYRLHWFFVNITMNFNINKYGTHLIVIFIIKFVNVFSKVINTLILTCHKSIFFIPCKINLNSVVSCTWKNHH